MLQLINYCLQVIHDLMDHPVERFVEKLTYWGSDSHDDAVSGVLDEVDDVAVVKRVDIHVVDGEDAVADVEAAAALGRRARDDPSDGGAGARHGGYYHKAEALVLAPRHSHVVGVRLGTAAVPICGKEYRVNIARRCLNFICLFFLHGGPSVCK